MSCDKFCLLKPNPLEPPCWKCSALIIKIWSLDKKTWVEHWETEMRPKWWSCTSGLLVMEQLDDIPYFSQMAAPPVLSFIILIVTFQGLMEITYLAVELRCVTAALCWSKVKHLWVLSPLLAYLHLCVCVKEPLLLQQSPVFIFSPYAWTYTCQPPHLI